MGGGHLGPVLGHHTAGGGGGPAQVTRGWREADTGLEPAGARDMPTVAWPCHTAGARQGRRGL
jgi:hypothetical protein